MWWLVSKKRFNQALKRIYGSLRSLTETTAETKTALSNLREKLGLIEGKTELLIRNMEFQQVSVSHQKTKSETYGQRIARKIQRRIKTPIQQAIINLLENNKLSTSELEKEIVKKRKLCSRASFFRYLGELKKSQVSSLKTKSET